MNTEFAFSTYPVTNVARARAFYEGVLGLKSTVDMDMGEKGHWIGDTHIRAAAQTSALSKYAGLGSSRTQTEAAPSGSKWRTSTPPVSESFARARQSQINMEPFPTPVCRMAFILDPEGNPLIIHKRKPGHH